MCPLYTHPSLSRPCNHVKTGHSFQCSNTPRDPGKKGKGVDSVKLATAHLGTFGCHDFPTMLGLFTTERGLVLLSYTSRAWSSLV